MMYRFLPIILIITFVITCCSSNKIEQVNSFTLHQLINKALTGDAEANSYLKGLFSYKHINKTEYYQLSIDSFQIDTKKYYSVLLEYPDPMLNLFAIYDNRLNLYLIDKSLNGNLSDEWIQIGARNFCFVQEKFLTKDILNLDRLSIYEIKNDSVNLIYRSLSRFVERNDIATQTIELVTPQFIVTKLSGLQDRSINDEPDTFYFNSGAKEYLSKLNLFNNYVKKRIKESGIVTFKPEIPSDRLENYSSPNK
jgi:hypothetical protein